jgi:hypothetical protein
MYTAPSRLKNRNSALASPEKWKNMPAIPTKDAKRPKVSKTVPDLSSSMRKVCSKDIDNKTVDSMGIAVANAYRLTVRAISRAGNCRNSTTATTATPSGAARAILVISLFCGDGVDPGWNNKR